MKYFLKSLWIPIRLTIMYVLEWITTIFFCGICPFIWSGNWDPNRDIAKITWKFWKDGYHTSIDRQFDHPYHYANLKAWIFDRRTDDPFDDDYDKDGFWDPSV